MGTDTDASVTSDNVKQWLRDQWRGEMEQAETAEAAPPTC
jgi:hypothetical protein